MKDLCESPKTTQLGRPLIVKHLHTIPVLSCAFFILFVSRPAQAQSNTLDHEILMLGGWELNEMRDDNGDFMGFWALPLQQLRMGNIRRLWFEPAGIDNWAVVTYEPVNADGLLDALIAGGLSEDSARVFRWRESVAAGKFSDEDIDGGSEGSVSKGFIAGDPLTAAAGALSDPTPMIDLLADVSYPVAPGMTELMVNGTLGVNASMNQATKQLLDCVSSPSSIECAGCICTGTITESDEGDWIVTQTVRADVGLRCAWSRSIVHTILREGQYSDCSDCAGTETVVEIETESIDIFIGDQCPSEPLGI